jgi:CubicO group peptidase (beta-lactamase class C family)
LRLYEKGIIDLDKPLYEYLPFKSIEKFEYSKLLTARIVLSHKTGLPNWGWDQKLEFKFKPGTAFGYSGEGYEYLKRVVEKVTNKDINQVLNEEVVEPLGLRHMYFQKNDYAAKFKSHGHYNGHPGKIDLTEKPWVAGCLVTNAQSFVKFLLAVKNRKGLKPETFEMMLSPQIEVPESFRENNWGFEEYMGLGIFVEKTTHGRVFRHSGNNGDFRAIFRIYDNLDMGYIIMTNGNTGKFLTNSLEKSLINIEKLTEVIK